MTSNKLFTVNILLVTLLTLANAPCVSANVNTSIEPESEKNRIQRYQETYINTPVFNSFNWLKEQRDYLSGLITDTATSTDKFISKADFDAAIENKSYVRVRFKEYFSKAGFNEFESDIKAKIDLPNSENKIKLIFDSDPDDFESLNNQQREINTGSSGVGDKKDNAIAGVQIDQGKEQDEDKAEHWKTSFDIGVKLEIPLDPFTRLRFRRYDDLPGLWQSRFEQKFFYFESEKGGASSKLDIYRPLGADKIIRSGTWAQYLDSENEWELSQVFSHLKQIDGQRSITNEIGISGSSQPKQVDSYWYRLEWRKLLYEDWLYTSVSPQLSFDRDEGYDARPSIFFQLEIFFTDRERRIASSNSEGRISKE